MKVPNSWLPAIVCWAVFAGCSSEEPAQPTQTSNAGASQSGGGHHHEAPHGGTLVEIGDHVAAIEFLFESASGTLTAYVLDAHAENPVRVSGGALLVEVELPGSGGYVPVELKGVENTLTGETVTDTSQFRGSDTALRGEDSIRVTIPFVTIRGAEYENISFQMP
jgi:hypothetical protein